MLDVAVVVSLILAIACAVYGFWAFLTETDEEKEIKDAAKEVSAAAKTAAKATTGDATLAETVTPQAAFSGPSEYLKALATFAEALGKLKRDLAAFVLSLAFLLVAVVGAGIEDKFEDKAGSTDTETPAAESSP